ncbi:hypothetical protein GX50_06510 [[Emmonsia] crescens]|uniref:Uncharacterized protein n=1 Tax=[Emmonsia] crescens TaxID=73230 RepID=A0A2B7ZCZ1_9EURO|nr:hypothetical protein GX50_08316 [Emmonsia crescens]PGH30697.1 hypothetical protein GX50_06510 [Emmonsia crescens]
MCGVGSPSPLTNVTVPERASVLQRSSTLYHGKPEIEALFARLEEAQCVPTQPGQWDSPIAGARGPPSLGEYEVPAGGGDHVWSRDLVLTHRTVPFQPRTVTILR